MVDGWLEKTYKRTEIDDRKPSVLVRWLWPGGIKDRK
jgi:hypothetical protein